MVLCEVDQRYRYTDEEKRPPQYASILRMFKMTHRKYRALTSCEKSYSSDFCNTVSNYEGCERETVTANFNGIPTVAWTVNRKHLRKDMLRFVHGNSGIQSIKRSLLQPDAR
jgi:hypothetical protein